MFSFRKPAPPPPPPAEPDPISPWEEHDELRRSADRAAAEDAARHGEDLLDRELPYTSLMVAQAATRLERVASARAERLAALRTAEASWTHAAEQAAASRAATGAALQHAGVPAECVDLPLRSEGRLRRLARALWLTPEDPWKQHEDLMRRHARARREEFEAVESLCRAEQAIARLTAVADHVARAEIALASELVERYRAALVHHLGPEALADGAGPAEQTVDVPSPDWIGTRSAG
jgi:hypothetical protein